MSEISLVYRVGTRLHEFHGIFRELFIQVFNESF